MSKLQTLRRFTSAAAMILLLVLIVWLAEISIMAAEQEAVTEGIAVGMRFMWGWGIITGLLVLCTAAELHNFSKPYLGPWLNRQCEKHPWIRGRKKRGEVH